MIRFNRLWAQNLKCHCASHWGIEFMGGSAKPPGKFFPAKTWKLIKNSMINLYEKNRKSLVNNFRPPPHKKLPYTALFYRTMTLKIEIMKEISP